VAVRGSEKVKYQMLGMHDMKTRCLSCPKAEPQVSEIEKW